MANNTKKTLLEALLVWVVKRLANSITRFRRIVVVYFANKELADMKHDQRGKGLNVQFKKTGMWTRNTQDIVLTDC